MGAHGRVPVAEETGVGVCGGGGATRGLHTSAYCGADRASLAPPASEPRMSWRSSYHASNSAPHSGSTPGGYGDGRWSHSAVILTLGGDGSSSSHSTRRTTGSLGHAALTGPAGGGEGGRSPKKGEGQGGDAGEEVLSC